MRDGFRVAVLGVTLGALVLGLPSSAVAATGTFSPDPINFGSVKVGGVASTTLTFTNTTGSDVTLTGINVDNPVFTLSTPGSGTACDSNPTLADQTSCTETISFNPTTATHETGTVTISFSDATALTDAVSGTGATPPVRITATSVKPAIFYPLVRDGFRDFTTYRVSFNRPASGRINLLNHKGTLTRSWAFSGRTSFAVAWGGRNRLGEKVKVGIYRFRVVAHNATNQVVSGFRPVRVTTGFRTKTTTGTKSHHGTGWSSRNWKAYSFGGNCNWGTLSGAQLLTTCLAAHASVTYKFTLPIGAKVTSFTHHVTAGIAPCRHVSWTTSHVGRVHRATFNHGSVNGFSQCAIGNMNMNWRVTRKIRI